MIKAIGTMRLVFMVLAMALFGQVLAESDAGHDNDYRTFHQEGKIAYGNVGDSYTADLVMYLAGNQFMVMQDLIKDFQKKIQTSKRCMSKRSPLARSSKGSYSNRADQRQNTAMNPDVYASVNLGHLKKLKSMALMDNYITYTHNKLELMVAEGNPKGIKGPQDLARDDLVQSHPNPLTEESSNSTVLKCSRIWGCMKKSPVAASAKLLGSTRQDLVHLSPPSETPHRIEQGEADVGIVWTTEVVHAKKEGRKVDGVAIPEPFNKQDKVGYAIGVLGNGRNQDNATRYLAYLATDDAQNIYSKYGFGRGEQG